MFAVLGLLAVAMLAVIGVPYARFTRYNREVLDKLRAYRPVLTMPYNGHAGFHIGLWSPYLERTGQPFTVVTTDALAFQRVAERYTMPVIYAPRADRRAIRAMLPETVRAALYVYSRNNADFMKVRRLTHVWLHHGDSDKEACFRRKSAAYDVLAVAGQAAIDRYAAHGVHVPSEKFKILGRPQIENIETATASISTVDRPVVLYAPTWYAADYKNNHSSLPIGVAIVSALLARNATVIFRPHPANRRLPEAAAAIAAIHELLRADAEATARPHRWGAAADSTFAELVNAADAMVADVSGVVTDFMQSLKPFAMVATGDKTDTFRARFPSSRSAYVIEWDLSTLDGALDAMLGDDPLAPIRVERREYYLGGYENGESARTFVRYLKSLTADPTPTAAAPAKPPVRVKTPKSACGPRSLFASEVSEDAIRRRSAKARRLVFLRHVVRHWRRDEQAPALNPSARPMTAMAAPAMATSTSRDGGTIGTAWRGFRHRTDDGHAASGEVEPARCRQQTRTTSAHGARGSRRVPINSTASALTPTRRPRCRDADVRGHRGGARPGWGGGDGVSGESRARPMRSSDRA